MCFDERITRKIAVKLNPDELVELLEYVLSETTCNCYSVIKDLESDNEYWFQFQRDRQGRITISEEDYRRITSYAEQLLDKREE